MSEASVSSTAAPSGCAGRARPALLAPLTILFVTDRPRLADSLPRPADPAWAEIQVASRDEWPAGADPDAVVVDIPPDDPEAIEQALAVAARLRDGPAAVLVLASGLTKRQRVALYRGGVLACLVPGEDAEELAARLASLVAAKRTASAAMRRLREYTRRLDEQLRLAQRLQRDFLPRRLPDIAGGRFAARLEPAAWVAGDFYDVFRLDERHVGFYVADAVGHGMPAALLTVFVKKSLQTKRIDGKRYVLIPPEEALRLLNEDLVSAELQEAPFITMVYGIYDEATGEFSYARAGHPKPLLVGPSGSIEPLEGDGPLLGIFSDAYFQSCRRVLEPGRRVIFYSDGAERVGPGRGADSSALLETIRTASLLPVEGMLDAVLDAVRTATGGDHLADDVTLVALDLDATAA